MSAEEAALALVRELAREDCEIGPMTIAGTERWVANCLDVLDAFEEIGRAPVYGKFAAVIVSGEPCWPCKARRVLREVEG